MARILVVDDYDVICQNLRFVFEQEGFEVETFNDPRKALDYCRRHRCDLVVSDVRMPGMDGLSLLDEIRRLQPGVRTIIISSRYDDEEETERKVMKRHCDFAFSKPFSIGSLLSAVFAGMIDNSETEHGTTLPVPA